MRIILAALIILIILVSGCAQNQNLTENKTTELLEKELCQKAGGLWNECGSPCLGTDAKICIQVCEAHCECGGIAGFKCPESYSCRLTGKITDELGVCVKK